MTKLVRRAGALWTEAGAVWRMRLLLLLVLLPAMLVLCFLTPPFQVADEPAHYLRADGVSHGPLTPERLIGEDERPAAGGEVHRGAAALVRDGGPRTIAH